jgi:repressor LexA
MKGLTTKQQNILDFIEEFQQRNGMSPTVYEIAEHFGIRSATAFAHLRALQQKGYIERSSKARSLTLKRSASPKHLSLTLSVPILGRISAGLPLLAEENIEDTLKMDPAMLPYGLGGHRLFGLRVTGESMIEAGINDGDVVIAKEDHTAEVGDIVIAIVEDEATMKYFHLGDNQVELRPANSTMNSQYYNYDQVGIQGKVVALYRTY